MKRPSSLGIYGVSVKPMVILATTSLDEEELVAKLADEIWRRPYQPPEGECGRVGVTKSKVRQFVMIYAKGYDAKGKKRLVETIYPRTKAIFHGHCEEWANKVKRRYEAEYRHWPPQKGKLKKVISEIAPRGARGPVLDLVQARSLR